MIDITTLRLGNILLYKGEPHYVSMLSLDIDDEYQELIGVTPLGKRAGEKSDWIRAFGTNELTPSYLTEEWLLKLGFEQDQDPDCKEWFNLGRFHVRMDESNSGFFYSGNDHASGGNADAIVRYVHQLQNLYFALTGEELKA